MSGFKWSFNFTIDQPLFFTAPLRYLTKKISLSYTALIKSRVVSRPPFDPNIDTADRF